ncbi:conserved hypothetical protein [Ricinus communis]|uniref:Uncharacterized protein n=1 Tax=Ricinus communis TaxID=3988 RepID=B9SII9_RICCO|nr:conserved hypothetical protein [Ricinus communis]
MAMLESISRGHGKINIFVEGDKVVEKTLPSKEKEVVSNKNEAEEIDVDGEYEGVDIDMTLEGECENSEEAGRKGRPPKKCGQQTATHSETTSGTGRSTLARAPSQASIRPTHKMTTRKKQQIPTNVDNKMSNL